MATYHVSQNPGKIGDDGADGSLDAPWATLDYAQAQLSAGDILYVAPGNYRESVIWDVDGDASNHIKMIGDPDLEQFGAATADYVPGVVRQTYADENEFATEPSSNVALQDLAAREFIEIHNMYFDGTTNSDINNTSYNGTGIDQSNSKYQNYVFNCMFQELYRGTYNVYSVENCVFAFLQFNGTYGNERVVNNIFHCVAGTGGAINNATLVYQNILIGGFYGIYNNERSYNNTVIGAYYANRTSNDSDQIYDSTCHGNYTSYYGQNNTGTGGEFSGSYLTACGRTVFRGSVANLRIAGLYQFTYATSVYPENYDGNVGTLNIDYGQMSLWSMDQIRETAKNVKPGLLVGYHMRGASDPENTAIIEKSASLDVDILGHPRLMGMSTASYHNRSTSTRRDLGPFEYSKVQITSSDAGSPGTIKIIDEGVHSLFVPIYSGSAITASISTQWHSEDMSDTKPQFILRYHYWYPSSSGMTEATPWHQTLTSGSGTYIQTTTAEAAASTWEVLKVSSSASPVNQIYELQFYSRNTSSFSSASIHHTGSTNFVLFNDLEIT